MGESQFTISKSFKSFENQLKILKSRDLIIEDEEEAINYLKKINYYRLMGYGLSFKRYDKDKYLQGTTFNNLIDICFFDWKLRSLLFKYLTVIEVHFRTSIAYYHTEKYGPLGYKNKKYFHNKDIHEEFLDSLESEKQRSKEVFVKHHMDSKVKEMPFWVAVELLSFSKLSLLFRNLPSNDSVFIASKYKASAKIISSWMHSLSHIRNVCAHHSRLYNKKLVIKPMLTKSMRFAANNNLNNDVFFCIVMIMYRLLDEEESRMFLNDLKILIEENFNVIDLSRIGFPANWVDVVNNVK